MGVSSEALGGGDRTCRRASARTFGRGTRLGLGFLVSPPLARFFLLVALVASDSASVVVAVPAVAAGLPTIGSSLRS
jgi:hypothetical protein